MYNIQAKPIQIVEPTKCVEWSVDTGGDFTKKIIDGNDNNYFIEINVNKKTGTITRYSDRKFETPYNGTKVDLKKIEKANELFGEAEFRYKGVTMQLK